MISDTKRFNVCIKCLSEKNGTILWCELNQKMILLCHNGVEKEERWFNPHNVGLPSARIICHDCKYKLEHEVLGQYT